MQRSRYQGGFLSGSEYSGTLTDLALGDFDLGLVVSSWEERCTALKHVHVTMKRSYVIKFNETNHEYDLLLRRHLRDKSLEIGEDLQGDVSDLHDLAMQIQDAVAQAYRTKGEPVSLFVDMTCLERYQLLHLLGAAIRPGLCRRITFMYAEGSYRRRDGEFLFTHGEWETVTVPYFPGALDPSRSTSFVVSAGFEGRRVLHLVSKIEPDTLTVVLPHPGFLPEYSDEAIKQNKELLHEFAVDREHTFLVPAGNALGVWQVLNQHVMNSGESNMSVLCLGTKPHTLGLGLCGLQNKNIQILYSKPQMFEKADIPATGKAWVYEIEDLSII